MFFNESHPYHFTGSFTCASFARLWFDHWLAFAIVMAGGIAWEIYQRCRSGKWYIIDTIMDLIMDAAGAALAIFPGWW